MAGRKSVTWTPEMDAVLIDMRSKGYGYHACGAAIGVDNRTCKARVLALGLPTWWRGGGRLKGGRELHA